MKDEGKGFEFAAEAAQSVLALKFDFVPALINLAWIALFQGYRKAAYAILQRAHAIAPFQNIVLESREVFEHGLS